MNLMRIVVVALMILVPAALRSLEVAWNIVPIGALALFCGSRFRNRWLALTIPIASMVLGDVLLGLKHHNSSFYTFHRLMPFVYGCFALSVAMGIGLRRHWNRVESENDFHRGEISGDQNERGSGFVLSTYVLPIAGTTLAGSVLFFLVTNFGDWWLFYPRTWNGLLSCYVAGVPFFRGTLGGDIVGSALLFGGDYLLRLKAASQMESERV